MTLMSRLLAAEGWTGSLDALAAKANEVSQAPLAGGGRLADVTRWRVIDYRTQLILSPARGKSYTWHHLVQLTAARLLLHKGWSREQISKWMSGRAALDLLPLIENEDVSEDGTAEPRAASSWEPEQCVIATRLLAAGVVSVFAQVRSGESVIQHEMPRPLVRAMHLLSSLQVAEARVDDCGSVHELLARCVHPFGGSQWTLSAMQDASFPYQGIRLVDPDSRVPTLDCVELAKNGREELDLREQLAFRALREISDSFPGREEEAYTLLRRFVAEHPFVQTMDLRVFERQHQLQAAAAFLASLYEPVQPHHLASGLLHICPGCRCPRRLAPLKGFVACRTRQCRFYDAPEPIGSAAIDSFEEMMIAKPHILLYWVGPALDELALYRTAVSAGLQPVLYPGRDSCDIALEGSRVGIDVKSHSSPFLLSESLRRSIGGLAFFDDRVIAVNDQSAARFPEYMRILQRECAGLGLQIYTVSALRRKLEKAE